MCLGEKWKPTQDILVRKMKALFTPAPPPVPNLCFSIKTCVWSRCKCVCVCICVCRPVGRLPRPPDISVSSGDVGDLSSGPDARV